MINRIITTKKCNHKKLHFSISSFLCSFSLKSCHDCCCCRFYFVGDEDLLEIIGNSKNIPRLQKHFKKMFAGVYSIILNEDDSHVIGLTSKEGEDVGFAAFSLSFTYFWVAFTTGPLHALLFLFTHLNNANVQWSVWLPKMADCSIAQSLLWFSSIL